MPPRYEFTFCPMSVTSRTPTLARSATSASTSGKARLTSRPRVCGTTQKAQTLSQPFITVTNSVTLPRLVSGSARGKTYSSRVHPGGLHHALALALHAADDLRQLGDGVRAEDEVQVGHLLEELVLLLLRHAPAHADQRAAGELHRAVAAQGGEHLVLGLLADGAGVEDDEVRLLRGRRGPVCQLAEHLAHAERVVDVHLAAEGVDEVALHGSFRTENGPLSDGPRRIATTRRAGGRAIYTRLWAFCIRAWRSTRRSSCSLRRSIVSWP